MTKIERAVNITAVILPFVGFLAAIILLWNQVIGWTDLGIMAGMYLSTAFGITIGFHRLLTHRAFATHRWMGYSVAVLGSMAVQGPVIDWVADHRKHHAHTDEEGDPHSPHVGGGSGLKGLFHAHMGWLWETQGQARKRQYAPDLLEDPGMRLINRGFPYLVLLSLGPPFVLGWAISGTLSGGLTAMIWGGFARIFMVHHVTWSINSICHFHGFRRFDTDDYSTNVPWLAALSLGEAWHHNHHAFPRAAVQGLRWWEFDPSGLAIRALGKIGLAWNVVRITPERQREQLAEGAS
ncbi:MAG: acyl-CoA desaturase [Thermoleophilaceae bacterium]|nr:acyl-CoA desaturase [Thermoleophilaceae bacterium]